MKITWDFAGGGVEIEELIYITWLHRDTNFIFKCSKYTV